MTPRQIREWTGGRWLASGAGVLEDELALGGLTIDSRRVEPGQVFLAIRGERFDGHDFVRQAAERGAAMAIVDERSLDKLGDISGLPLLVVAETIAALGRLAGNWRRQLRATVIGITGSVGKTTTKRLIDAVLSTELSGTTSPASFNNHIGVPLTLLEARPIDQFVICEIGTSAPGEIAALTDIARPDIAIITHAAAAHTQGLGSLEAIAREKASIMSHMNPDGLAIVNGDVAALLPHHKLARKRLTYGRSASCDLRLTAYTATAQGSEFQVNDRWAFKLSLPGEHNAINALAAIAVGRHLNLPESRIATGLAQAAGPPMRLQVTTIGPPGHGVTLINDAYNANPESMQAAVDVLLGHPTCGRRLAILGDMLELGEASPAYHRELGRSLVQTTLDRLVLIGPLCRHTAEPVRKAWLDGRLDYFEQWADDLPGKIAGMLEPGDTVLIKGSRGMALERLVSAMEGRFG
jgi:UDP-N-acetylmuramoyl-tripeptide--D-alanyl-D-alanine ligase